MKLTDRTTEWGLLSFDRCAGFLERQAAVKALMIGFYRERHTVALFRESADNFQFYDSNVGSDRVVRARRHAFLANYDDVCLTEQMADLPTQPFQPIYQVEKRPGR